MCGIAVAIGWPEAEITVRRLVEGILHRGDVTDPVVSPRNDIAMGTRRLRIVDADHAVQPQISFNGRLAVSFNGEIYNYIELRKELASLGIAFRTESDTEVLANALQDWGYRALERLVGMYAFVAVDLANGEFLAARDPFGVKPLYVIQSGISFVFCSEMPEERPLFRSAASLYRAAVGAHCPTGIRFTRSPASGAMARLLLCTGDTANRFATPSRALPDVQR